MIKICAQEQSLSGELLPLQPVPNSRKINTKEVIYKNIRFHGYSIDSIHIESAKPVIDCKIMEANQIYFFALH
jgi:hypothetical protein